MFLFSVLTLSSFLKDCFSTFTTYSKQLPSGPKRKELHPLLLQPTFSLHFFQYISDSYHAVKAIGISKDRISYERCNGGVYDCEVSSHSILLLIVSLLWRPFPSTLQPLLVKAYPGIGFLHPSSVVFFSSEESFGILFLLGQPISLTHSVKPNLLLPVDTLKVS